MQVKRRINLMCVLCITLPYAKQRLINLGTQCARLPTSLYQKPYLYAYIKTDNAFFIRRVNTITCSICVYKVNGLRVVISIPITDSSSVIVLIGARVRKFLQISMILRLCNTIEGSL